jgi:hypothetical protein
MLKRSKDALRAAADHPVNELVFPLSAKEPSLNSNTEATESYVMQA